jgi:hypothetical protein
VPTAGAESNTIPDAMISAYKIVHAMGKTQLGGVRGDWLRDLYHREFGDVDDGFIMGIINIYYYIN